MVKVLPMLKLFVFAPFQCFKGKKKSPMLKMWCLETELQCFLRGEENRANFLFSLNSVFYLCFLIVVELRFVIVFFILLYSSFNINTN